MASLAAKAARVRDDLESSRLPIGSTIMWMGSLASVPPTYLIMQGQTPAALAAYPALLAIFPAGLPDTRDRFPRGAHAGRLPATIEEDAIRNIVGQIAANDGAASAVWLGTNGGTGPFASGTAVIKNLSSLPNTASGSGNITFDASRTVPTASENRPKSIAACMLVKAYHNDQALSADSSSGSLFSVLDERYVAQDQNVLYGINLLDNPRFSVCQRPTQRRIGSSGHLRPVDRWSVRHSSLTGQAFDASTMWPTADITKSSYLYINTESMPKAIGGTYFRQDHFCGVRGTRNFLAEIIGSGTKELVFSAKFASSTGDPLQFTGLSLVATNFTTKAEFATMSVSSPVTIPGAGAAVVIKDLAFNIENFINTIYNSGVMFNNIVISIFVSFAPMGNGTYRFEHFKLEVGNKSTPMGTFDQSVELNKCKSYYNFIDFVFGTTVTGGGNGAGFYDAKDVPMMCRTPTVTYGSGLNTSNANINKINVNQGGVPTLITPSSGGVGYNVITGSNATAVMDASVAGSFTNASWSRASAEFEAEPLVV